MEKCTRCHKELSDFWVLVELKTKVIRNREDDIQEDIKNSEIFSQETLCLDCFSKFCDVLENGMKREE